MPRRKSEFNKELEDFNEISEESDEFYDEPEQLDSVELDLCDRFDRKSFDFDDLDLDDME